MQEITKNKELHKDIAVQVNEMMLDRLRDIDGLDSVDWWPLAPGWWVIIILLIAYIIVRFVFFLRRRAWMRSWQGKAFCELEQMQKNLNEDNAQQMAIKLSQLIRRIAMHKYSRLECGSLVGKDWLEWLTMRDGNKFNWVKNGTLLTEEVFADSAKTLSISKLNSLINATKNWAR